ncbi:MAG: hypothetical protein ABSG69_05665 [Candidatus Acidiferrum sp.]|jgi:hypothetical protein
MRCFYLTPVLSLVLGGLLAAGCQKGPTVNYLPLEQSGLSSSTVAQLKKLQISDSEIPEILKVKNLGLSDETCLALVNDARAHHHSFSSGDSASNLIGAGYTEQDVLNMGQSDQLDTISTEAITLKLIGLSAPTVQTLVARLQEGQPTLSSAVIGQLKNTGVSERQILEYVNEGMTDEQAEKEVAARTAKRNHANTDFVRTRARRQ